jgi:hypothetical protein
LEQIELLRYALQVLEAAGVEHMLVGSMASMAYGEPRMTRDIDNSLVVQWIKGFGSRFRIDSRPL